MSVEILQSSPDRIEVRGSLVFATAREAHELGVQALTEASGSEVTVDCSAVTQADSAGLVVLLDWLALARIRNVKLHFASVPDRMLAVARISEIEELLTV